MRALYTATDEETAWAEVAARFRRQGIHALPPAMGLIRMIILVGRYVDLSNADGCERWDLDAAAVQGHDPTDAQREHCWAIARAISALADFLVAPSARAAGRNVALMPDRTGAELRMELESGDRRPVPEHLAQQPQEEW